MTKRIVENYLLVSKIKLKINFTLYDSFVKYNLYLVIVSELFRYENDLKILINT